MQEVIEMKKLIASLNQEKEYLEKKRKLDEDQQSSNKLNKEKLESDVAFEKKQKDIKSKREEIEDLEKNLPSMPQSKSKAYFETRLTQLKKEVENEREEIQDYMAEIYNKNGMGKPDATIMSLLKNIDDKNLAPLAQIITSASAQQKNKLTQKKKE